MNVLRRVVGCESGDAFRIVVFVAVTVPILDAGWLFLFREIRIGASLLVAVFSVCSYGVCVFESLYR